MKKLILSLLIPLLLFANGDQYAFAGSPSMDNEMEKGFYIGKELFYLRVLKSDSGRHVWITPGSSPKQPVWKFRSYPTPLNVRIEVSYMGEERFKIIEHEPTGQKTYLVKFDGKTAQCELAPEATSSQLSSSSARSEETDTQSSAKFVRPWLGIIAQDLTPEFLKHSKVKEKEGVLVGGVHPGTGAEKAGLTSGDIIKSVDDKAVKNANELVKEIQSDKKVGQKIKLGIIRYGEPMTIELTTTAMPEKLANSEEAELAIYSNPPGAKVKLDGQEMGITPLRVSGDRLVPGNVGDRVLCILSSYSKKDINLMNRKSTI